MYSPLRTPSVFTSVSVPSGDSTRKCSFIRPSLHRVNVAGRTNVRCVTAGISWVVTMVSVRAETDMDLAGVRAVHRAAFHRDAQGRVGHDGDPGHGEGQRRGCASRAFPADDLRKRLLAGDAHATGVSEKLRRDFPGRSMTTP